MTPQAEGSIDSTLHTGVMDASTVTQIFKVTFDNCLRGMPTLADRKVPYSMFAYIMWAPRKMQVSNIGAGASDTMLCFLLLEGWIAVGRLISLSCVARLF
jgi:hypothetical protein